MCSFDNNLNESSYFVTHLQNNTILRLQLSLHDGIHYSCFEHTIVMLRDLKAREQIL